MDKIVQVTKQMTSEAFLYMNRSEDNTQETYGLKMLNCPPEPKKWYCLKNIYAGMDPGGGPTGFIPL